MSAIAAPVAATAPNRTRLWIVAAIVAALLAAVVAAIVIWQRRQKKPNGGGGGGDGGGGNVVTLGYRDVVFRTCDASGACGDFQLEGNDARGTNDDPTMNYYRAIGPTGSGRLGDYVDCTAGCVAGHAPFAAEGTTSVVVDTANLDPHDPLAPKHPIDFGGGYCMSCAARPFSVWSLVCPAGYSALGDVVHAGCGKPAVGDYYCVPDACTEAGAAGPYVWRDDRTCPGTADQGVILYSVVAPDPTTAVSGRFFKAVFGDPIAPPPTSGLSVLRNKCSAPKPPPPPPPPPVDTRIAGGRYRIRWGAPAADTYLGFYPLDAIVLVSRSAAVVWDYTAPAADPTAGGRLARTPDWVLGSIGTATPATPILVSPSKASAALVGVWVASRTAPTAPAIIYNTYLKGCLQGQPLGGGGGSAVIASNCSAATRNWYFEPVA
ncbi:hypothetical protein [Pandoravirus japonicus]|uniref:Uncharacterized protein n=1 Tax=Pandoravirus japonicus TaxID=2823154 RepID=A0A811BNP2_9VIRU|nr:hypothetical protein [Pandoravirus japonicus]